MIIEYEIHMAPLKKPLANRCCRQGQLAGFVFEFVAYRYIYRRVI